MRRVLVFDSLYNFLGSEQNTIVVDFAVSLGEQPLPLHVAVIRSPL
jgi:hypothetical protein